MKTVIFAVAILASATVSAAECHNDKIVNMQLFAGKDLEKYELEIKLARLELETERPELREVIRSAPVQLPTRRYLVDARDADMLAYPMTCRYPFLEAALDNLVNARSKELMRLHALRFNYADEKGAEHAE